MPLIMSLAEFGLSGAFSIDSELLVRLFDPPQEFVCSAFLKFRFDLSASVSTLITTLCSWPVLMRGAELGRFSRSLFRNLFSRFLEIILGTPGYHL